MNDFRTVLGLAVLALSMRGGDQSPAKCLDCSQPGQTRCPALGFAVRTPPDAKPRNGTRNVVILGSSVAAGVGASRYDRSWAGILTDRLTNRGFRVVNKSISGSTTEVSLERFDRDVTPLKPDFVVLCTGIVNEGFTLTPQSTFDRYLQNTALLVLRTKSIGAVPVLCGMYPNADYSPAANALLRALYDAMDLFGIPVLDFLSVVADPSGHWLPGMTVDGSHPTDVGHLRMAESIPTGFFEAAYQWDNTEPSSNSGAWTQYPKADSDGTIDLASPVALPSWTVSVHARTNGSSGGERVLRIRGERNLDVEHREDAFYILVDGYAVGRIPAAARTWSHLGISYQAATGTLLAHINGNEAIFQLNEASLSLQVLTLGESCRGCSYANGSIYRSSMSMDDLSTLQTGRVLRKSLEYWNPLNDPVVAEYLVNYAGTTSTGRTRGAWFWDNSQVNPACGPIQELEVAGIAKAGEVDAALPVFGLRHMKGKGGNRTLFAVDDEVLKAMANGCSK